MEYHGGIMRILAAVILVMLAPLGRAADSAEATVQKVYDVISGPAGTRDWDTFRALFAEGARLIPVRMTADGPVATVLSVDDYAKRAGATFGKTAFYESEVSRRVEIYGDIAHVFSTYESRRAPGEKPFARGINSFQLVRQGGAWKVITILWESETESNPIPAKYLP